MSLAADLVRALAELALARLALARGGPLDFLAEPEAALRPATAADGALIDRIAFALPRVAARVPWRATCLVQALAARRWLARHGIASSIRLGARKPAGALDAHAWLEANGRVVVGGDPAPYAGFTPAGGA